MKTLLLTIYIIPVILHLFLGFWQAYRLRIGFAQIEHGNVVRGVFGFRSLPSDLLSTAVFAPIIWVMVALLAFRSFIDKED